MERYAVLYNPRSNAGHGLETAKKLEKLLPGAEFVYQDLMQVRADEFAETLPEGTDLIFTGGDGTINHVVNQLYGKNPGRKVYYFAAGTGNDFMIDIEKKPEDGPVLMDGYIEHLPVVTVNGEDHVFVNGIGLGLDGFCCDLQNTLKAEGKNRPYTLIAVQGLLWGYKPANAEVTVDGVTKKYNKVWMASTMLGRHFGGGVVIAPDQKRDAKEKTVTSVVIHGVSPLKAMTLFLKVCAGQGPKYPKYITYTTGHEVSVKFDRSVSMEIDGETVREVSSYHVVY